MRLAKCTLSLILVSLILLPLNVQAHSADTFTVVVKDTGLTPNSSQIMYNDSVIWHNVDSTENITHRIVFDGDGDGLYNGSNDWDSGQLYPECGPNNQTNQTNSSESDDCNITFLIWFNGTFGVGEYQYQDILSNGTVLNGTIIVMEDVHPAEAPPPIGSTFGVFDDEDGEPTEVESESEPMDAKQMILLIGVGSGVSAILLIVILLRRSGLEE
jgi:plastocyanin